MPQEKLKPLNRRLKYVSSKVIEALGSRRFFWFTIGLFIVQAAWIAMSFRYPMIYDEYYHFGIIQQFSRQWLPWIHNQPTNLDLYGSLQTTPFLLFHYVLGFPLKLIALFTDGQIKQIIILRILNIFMFGSGLVVFERLFSRMKIQPIFRNIALLFFVLLPATPFVAATINYDNAIFPLTALFLLAGLRIIQDKKTNWINYAWFLIVGAMGLLTKNVFIPIFLTGLCFITAWTFRTHRNDFMLGIKSSFKESPFVTKCIMLLITLLLLVIGLNSYGRNLVEYRSISPSCIRVMNIERCRVNPVQKRGIDQAEIGRKGVPVQAPQYNASWFTSLLYTLLISAINTKGISGTVITQPLPVIYFVVFWFSIISFGAVFYSLDKLRKINGFWFVSSVTVLYIFSIYIVNLGTYNTKYQPWAIHGRYLLPVLPVVFIYSLMGLNNAFRRIKFLKLPMLALVTVFYLNGAGLITHIVRSDETWDWDIGFVRLVNNKSRDLLKPVIKEKWYDTHQN